MLGPLPGLPAPDGGTLHLHAFRSGRHIGIDIERISAGPTPGSLATAARSVLETFRHATGSAELLDRAVRGLKTLLGYDRVIAYRFHEDHHGEVIAEAREDPLEPYLGLHYPAGDIPTQARALYLRRRVGEIPDACYQPVPLLAETAPGVDHALDLTHSALRSVARSHTQYMRNMKTAASLTVALPDGLNLWGLLVCHHSTARTAGPEQRAVADMIGQVTSLLLARLGDAEATAQRLARTVTLRNLTRLMSAPVPLPQAMAEAGSELLALVEATGALIRMAGSVVTLGHIPPIEAAERALAVLYAEAAGNVVAVDNLGIRDPELAACISQGSGALLLPLAPETDDAILWFRPELARTIAWGGNPDQPCSLEPATGLPSPRTSFAAWIATVAGQSVPWTPADVAVAHELWRLIEAEQSHRIKAELARLRHYDSLTNLPNRSLLEEWLATAGSHAKDRSAGDVALLFLDLDRFKAVNDTLGHADGDRLLTEVARRLVAAAGSNNRIARLGGDEFVVFCQGQNHQSVSALAERIRRAIEAPFDIGGRACYVSISIGIAFAGDVGKFDLVRAADMAMYVAKQCGGNRAVVFEPTLYERAVRQFELDRDMHQALAAGNEFVLVYQPVFSVAGDVRSLVGFEALVRWRHPRQGWLAPDLFIPIAEKSGLIQPLGDWVLRHALRQGLAFGRLRPELKLSMSVNVSVSQLSRPGFGADVTAALQAEGFPPEALCLEVTESMLTDIAMFYVLTDLRALGIRIAIDDFGIGYSSLSYLFRLPADVVKLDRSFLETVGGDDGSRDFIGAVIGLAHAAGKSVIVEGIETQAQLDVATGARTDMVQGFLLARPLSAESLQDALRQVETGDARLEFS
ncbi:MAG: EAL domain-containing protein [Rhodopila sp.]